MINKYLILSFLGLLQITTSHVQQNKETVLDRKTHIEDGIHYSIPELPKLCDRLNLEIPFVDIGNCKFFVELEGEGTPIVLINGGHGGTHHYFHPWFSALKDKHRIICYDQRGTRQSYMSREKVIHFCRLSMI